MACFKLCQNPFNGNTGGESTATVNTIATPVADVAVQAELDSLTQELAKIRLEIEALKGQSNA